MLPFSSFSCLFDKFHFVDTEISHTLAYIENYGATARFCRFRRYFC